MPDLIEELKNSSENNQESVLKSIRKFCVLFYIEFRGFEGRLKIDGAKIIVEDREITDDYMTTKASWKILPEEWTTSISKIETLARKIIRNYGTSFKRGVYLVPREKFGELAEKLEELKVRYDKNIEEQVNNWETVLERTRQYVTEKVSAAAWNSIRNRLPSKENVAKKYSMRYGFWPIGSDSFAIAKMVNFVDASLSEMIQRGILPEKEVTEIQSHIKAIKEECGEETRCFDTATLREHFAFVRQETEKMLKERLEFAFEEPKRELAEAINNLIEKIGEPRSLKQAAVSNVQRAFEKLKSFAWMCPQDLVAKMNEVESSIQGMDRNSLLDTSTREGLTRMIRSVSESINSSGSGRRMVDI